MEVKRNLTNDSLQQNIDKISAENFYKWNESLKTGNANLVANLYTKDATFLPTMSPDFKVGIDGAREYFTHFLQKKPIGKVIYDKVQVLGPNSYLHSGMYNFEVGPDNNRQILEARFTFIWVQNNQGEWKIAHHHSSVKPNH